jgi:hypothetical protein
MKPDLYTLRPDNHLDLLFECKTDSATQSWYTAISQLVVYGASQRDPPKRILVCPGCPQDPSFKVALEHLCVALLLYQIEDSGEVSFPKLVELLCDIVRRSVGASH